MLEAIGEIERAILTAEGGMLVLGSLAVDADHLPKYSLTRVDSGGAVKWRRVDSGFPVGNDLELAAGPGAAIVRVFSGKKVPFSRDNPSLRATVFDRAGNVRWDLFMKYAAEPAAAVDEQGRVWLAYSTYGGSRISLFDLSGRVQWTRAFLPSFPIEPVALAPLSNGVLALVGKSEGDALFLKIDPDGKAIGSARLGGSLHTARLTPDGSSFFVDLRYSRSVEGIPRRRDVFRSLPLRLPEVPSYVCGIPARSALLQVGTAEEGEQT